MKEALFLFSIEDLSRRLVSRNLLSWLIKTASHNVIKLVQSRDGDIKPLVASKQILGREKGSQMSEKPAEGPSSPIPQRPSLFGDEWITWKAKRETTVKLLRAVAAEVSRTHRNANIAKLTGTSTSLVGAGLAIGGFVAAFFTFGASLIVTAVGIGLGAAGGLTAGGSELCDLLLSKSQLKLAQDALEDDRKATQTLNKAFQQAIESKRGLAAAAEAGGKTLFQAMETTTSKGLHIGGLALSAVLVPFGIHDLVTTSMDVHKGSIPAVFKEINEIVGKLENELRENKRIAREFERAGLMIVARNNPNARWECVCGKGRHYCMCSMIMSSLGRDRSLPWRLLSL